MPDRQPATNIVRPAAVQIGTKSFSVDTWAVPRTNPWDGLRCTVELKQLSDDCLVLEPRKRALFWHAPIILAVTAGPVAGLVYMLREEFQGNADWVVILVLVIGLLLIIACSCSWVYLAQAALQRFGSSEFDRHAGLLTISRRPFGFWRSLQVIRSRPLTDIVCVQLLYGGFHSESVEIGEPGTPGSVVHQNYHSYQFNLVFNDRNEPRYNLTTHADWKWLREAGQKLANFLGVPVVDQLC